MTADLIRRIGEYSAVDRAVCDNGEGQAYSNSRSPREYEFAMDTSESRRKVERPPRSASGSSESFD